MALLPGRAMGRCRGNTHGRMQTSSVHETGVAVGTGEGEAVGDGAGDGVADGGCVGVALAVAAGEGVRGAATGGEGCAWQALSNKAGPNTTSKTRRNAERTA